MCLWEEEGIDAEFKIEGFGPYSTYICSVCSMYLTFTGFDPRVQLEFYEFDSKTQRYDLLLSLEEWRRALEQSILGASAPTAGHPRTTS